MRSLIKTVLSAVQMLKSVSAQPSVTFSAGYQMVDLPDFEGQNSGTEIPDGFLNIGFSFPGTSNNNN